MTPQEIVKGMTPTPWHVVDYAGYQVLQSEPYYDADQGLLDEDKCQQAPVNALAATLAVGNSYGKNLNPLAYEDVVNALGYAIGALESVRFNEESVQSLQEALNKARII